jgi:hypothetical protein
MLSFQSSSHIQTHIISKTNNAEMKESKSLFQEFQSDNKINSNSKSNQPLKFDFKEQIQFTKKKNPILQDMIVAVNNTVVEKPQENEKEEYLHVKVFIDDIVSKQESMNISELMKGKLVEDLLEIEWLSVKNAPCGQTGMIKISEGRIVKLLDGTLDYLSLEESYDEIIELQSLWLQSLQFQSLLYTEIAKNLIPFKENNPAPFTICNTKVSLIIDISSSMTTLNHSKLISAQILAAGLTSILSVFHISMKIYAFADREAIWELSDISKKFPFLDLLHLIDALRTGGRPGSYPLDALLTSQAEWENCSKLGLGQYQETSHHFNIIISDFISAQVLDKKRD